MAGNGGRTKSHSSSFRFSQAGRSAALRRAAAGIPVLLVFLLASCSGGGNRTGELQAAQAGSLRVSSPAFQAGSEIPAKYTCSAENVSPPLDWSAPPEGAKSLALITDDPDAPGGTWVHWVAYNLPASLRKMPEAVPKQPKIAGGGLQGKNDFGDFGYGGPCPPPGNAHHYHFKLYALDVTLNLAPGASKQDVVKAMRGHILAEGELVALFKR